MTFIKVYNIVKLFTTIFMAALFIVIDISVLYFRDYILFLLFIPIEAAFVILWFLILKFNKNTVYRIYTDNGKIDLLTYGGSYTVRAEKISVKSGSFFCVLYFDGIKLRANSSSKSVGAFLHKYQNIYRKIKK